MLLEQESPPRFEPLFLDIRHRAVLKDAVLKAVFRFPKLLNRSLYRSFEQMVVNSTADFLSNRALSHLRMILAVQFFLQKRMEAAIQPQIANQKCLFLKLFRAPSRVCISLVFTTSYTFQKEQLLKSLDILLPGVSEIPRSFYSWSSPEWPYSFCYFEIDKLRGEELSAGQLRSIEKTLKEQMLASSPLTPAVFWPYNKEESHRQIQILLREMKTKQDLPHVSIHFQEETASSLEFLIHVVRPKGRDPLAWEKLPDSLYYFYYSRHELQNPFPIEAETFSIKLKPQLFDVCDTINLLYARRYLAKHLEMILGPFRDYNGGLFEKQQDHFEMVRLELATKVPCFHLFAEKLFYALHPFERWFSLTIEQVEDLFLTFSELIQDQNICAAKSTVSGLFTVVKTENRVDFLRSTHKKTALKAHAQLTIGNFHYECFSGRVTEEIQEILKAPDKEQNTLRLVFQEGSPPSLNPHYSAADMRCRLLNKLLFEGLFRLDSKGEPELAGASAFQISSDGKTYTLQLRKAYWSNGEKVTAVDYVDSWKWALQDLGSHPELLFAIKNARKFKEKKCSIDAVGILTKDLETIEVELEEPDPKFLIKLAQPFFFPLFGAYREPKWFNGPYLVHQLNKNGLKLGRNPYYWNPQQNGFEHIDVQWNGSIDVIYELFKAGKIDWIGDPLSTLSLEQVRNLEKDGFLQRKKVCRRFAIHFNTQHPVLQSVFIRKALSAAIDRTLICKDIFPHSIEIENESYSPKQARLFFEKGLEELGLTRSSCPALTFSYSNHTRREPLALYLQETWEKTLGISIHLDQQNWNSFRSYLEKRNFEMCGTIQDTVNEHSLSYLERFEGSNSWNFAQWSHPTYRELMMQCKQESDLQKQAHRIAQAEKLLSENVPFAPLFDYTHLYAINPQLDCSHFDLEGCVDFSHLTKRQKV